MQLECTPSSRKGRSSPSPSGRMPTSTPPSGNEMDTRTTGQYVKDLIDRAELDRYWEGGRN